jgi:hypothetical protein
MGSYQLCSICTYIIPLHIYINYYNNTSTLGKSFEVWGTFFVPLCTPNLWMYPHVPHFLMGTCTPLCTPFEIQCCDQTDLLTNSGILCDSLRVSLCTLLIRVSLSQCVGSPPPFSLFCWWALLLWVPLLTVCRVAYCILLIWLAFFILLPVVALKIYKMLYTFVKFNEIEGCFWQMLLTDEDTKHYINYLQYTQKMFAFNSLSC